MTRHAVSFLAGLLLGAALATFFASDVNANCGHKSCAHPSAHPTIVASAIASSTPGPSPSRSATVPPSASPTVAPTPSAAASAPTYLFDDEFSGSALGPAWGRWISCCGTIAGYNPPTVSGGSLHLTVSRQPAGWFGGTVDTHAAFTFTYGYAEARILVPEGVGLWPAFWLYFTGSPEIDVMEICANPLGTNGGNDASVLHTTVHYGSGSQQGHSTSAGDLSLAWHTYGVDWRPDHITFSLDGLNVWTTTTALVSTPQDLTLDLGVGGGWCGNPTSATPSSSEMLVDYVRVSP